MASFEHKGSTLAYEIHGEGPAVLALAPGGMRSATALWGNAPFNPLSVLSDRFTVISMDQRNAGASAGPCEKMMVGTAFLRTSWRSWITWVSSGARPLACALADPM